jgi:replication factor C large subunit
MLWTHKYLPKNLAEIQGQNKAVEALKNFKKNFPKKRAAMLIGPCGTGKTSAAYALANELDLELIEVNASDVRNADSIKEKLGNAMGQMSLFMKEKLILVDEIDGISGTADRGGLLELKKLIDVSKYPVIMTANEPYDPKFMPLRKISEEIEFHSLNYLSILAVLKLIARHEGIEHDEISLATLARRAGGDLRAAINDFQTVAKQNLVKEDIETLSQRRQKETIINALMRIFKTTSPEIALPALDDCDEELDDIFLWIDENLPKEYKDIKDLAKAYDILSLADVFRGRIARRQHWRFRVYINDLLTAGIALSKKEKYSGFNKYQRTTRVLRIWQSNQKNAKRDAIAIKIAEKTHTSKRRVIKDTLPYIRTIFKTKKGNELADYFGLEKEEVMYLSS